MAIAHLSPLEQTRRQRQNNRLYQMSSRDPVERWNAQEAALTEACEEASRNLIAQARQREKDMERRERELQRIEREYYGYKPLPPWAKIKK